MTSPSLPQFDALLEAAPDAMVIIDSEGAVIHVNAQTERLFGIPRGEIIGQPIELLIPPRFRGAHPGHRRGYFHDPRPRPMGAAGVKLYGLRRDGSEFPAEVSLSPMTIMDETLVIAAIRDLTSRKIAEEERVKLSQAQEAIRLRDEFLSIASHELRTPLTALQMQVDSVLRAARLKREPLAPERMAAKMETIHEAVKRLNALINQLLDLSRITSGRLTIEREEADLGKVVLRVLALFRDELERSGCAVTFHADEAPIVGRWDTLRLEQVITNLLANAIKYGLGKPIEVTVRAGEGCGILSVGDQGIGIAEADQRRVFERFERIVTGRNYGGFGLGLWIVREILDAHGGSIEVQSALGVGSTFTVTLPIARPAPGDRAGRPAIMLVDDDAMIRETFQAVVEDEGFTVLTAANGAEALALLRAGARPGMIFLDLMMPVLDGAGFCAAWKADPALAAIPVVIVSAASDIGKQAGATGATLHLTKPLDMEEIFRLIERYCGGGRASS
jgi:PAS domain S-box-containing protein